MKSAFVRSAAALAIATIAASGQTNLGSIQGTVVGSDGTLLSGVRVYAAVKAASQKTSAPPTLMAYVGGGALSSATAPPTAITYRPTASPAGTFLISKLPADAYTLCAQIPASAWLDPCHWSASVPAVTLAAGQNLTGQTVVMTKGAVIQVKINDPSHLLAARPGAIPQDVEVIAHASNNAYYNAQVASAYPGVRNLTLTLPFGATHTLIVSSKLLALTDSTGAAVPTTGHTQPLQIPSGAASPQFVYTVAGKSH